MNLSVHNRKRTGREFGGHSKEGGDDHPEYRAGSTKAHRNGHPGDVSQSHCRRQRTGEGLEVRNLPGIVRIVVFAANDVDGMSKPPQGQPSEKEGVVDATQEEYQ